MPAYYNEHDEFAAAWLRNLIAAGHVAPGDVDTRSIVDVRPDDLAGYTQCHFFAGIGGWSHALRLAGWGDERPVWTGSCPCQPFSLAGQQKGFADERHLWPAWRKLIAERRPARIFGEQVASATAWLGLVRGDLEALDYAVGAIPFEAASAGADHLRNRYGLVAHDTRERRGEGRPEHGVRLGLGIAAAGGGSAGNDVANNNKGSQGWSLLPECAGERIAGPDGMADADRDGIRDEPGRGGGPRGTGAGIDRDDCQDLDMGLADSAGRPPGQPSAAAARYGSAVVAAGGGDVAEPNFADQRRHTGNPRSAPSQGSIKAREADGYAADGPCTGGFDWVIGADGKARRVKSGIRLLVNGFPNRVGLLRGFGNAIDPRAFAQFIAGADEAVGDFLAMTAALAKSPVPVLRNAAGEPPLGVGGLVFRDDQGEMFENGNERYRSPAARIGVLELEDGRWLAHPPGFRSDIPVFFETRAAAIDHAVDEVVSRAHRYMQNGEGEGTHWTADYGGHVVAWAVSLKEDQRIQATRADAEASRDHPGSGAKEINTYAHDSNGLDTKTPSEEITPQDTASTDSRVIAGNASETSGSLNPESPSDPVVAELVATKRERRIFPAGHTFSMTNPVINGHMVTLGTCGCGHSFSYPYGSAGHERMDAAIEAHWQSFDHLPEKVDGRGQPIGSPLDSVVARTKPRRKRKESVSAPEGMPAPNPAPSFLDSSGAGEIAEDGRRNALTAIAAGDTIDGQIARDLIGEGLVYATATKLMLTEEGNAFLQNEVAPIGAGSEDGGVGPLLGVDRVEAPVMGSAQGEKIPSRVSAEPALLSDDDDLDLEWPSYQTFLEDKIVTAPMRGIEVLRDSLHPWLKPHCKDLTLWALRLGCAAIFANFGLHKTAMQLEWCRQLCKYTGRPTLCVVPLGVRHGFISEALQLGMDVRFIRTTEELDELYVEGIRHFLTNYESIREGKLDPNQFAACSLDEASVLRSYGSKTFQEFLPLFAKVEFKLVATATPSPNRYKELIHYAGFLGVMDTGLALTRWFQRNSEKAGDLTLYPHKEAEFWMWVHSWAAFLQRPSELGYSDEGYELPPLKLTWHEVPADHSKATPERDGQGVMFRDIANSLQEAAKSRRDSLSPRVAKMIEIIAQDPEPHRIIWHDLEAEREAIEQALPEVVTISGSMDIDDREIRLHDFEQGRIKYFGTKPILSGSGSNFQYHCHKAIYVALPGYGYKFNDFIQSLYRLQRFGQEHPVEVDIIYSEDERAGRAALEEKWALDTEMRQRMSEIILAHGLNTLPLRDAMLRTIGVKRVEIAGENFRAINNDAVAEARAWPENSVDLMVSSIPFGKQYEYSASYRDFGHSDDNAHFWSQMDFLTTELLRMLKPGRLACIHVKDRILFGSVTGQGVPTVEPFHAEAIMHYRAHGFQYMGMITVVTDVVRENNQTYRLGWSEMCKDGTKMGVGMPEYILLLRKPQSDRSRGYADVPVVKHKKEFKSDLVEGDWNNPDGHSRARWQIDAHSHWRSSGNRQLTPEEFASFSSADLARLFAKTSVDRVYDYEAHVSIGETVERTGTLPATFMAIAPGSHHADVWHDVNRMRTLNMMQQRKGAEMHLCPLQFDIVDRLIERYSNEGDLVFDPFGGLMTVPYRALLKKRKGAATELSAAYFLDGVHYLHMAEEKMAVPEMFDLAQLDAANTPPRR